MFTYLAIIIAAPASCGEHDARLRLAVLAAEVDLPNILGGFEYSILGTR